MTDHTDAGLAGWVAALPHEEVVRRYRALPDAVRFRLIADAWDEVGDLYRSDEPYGERVEHLARRFEVFADGEDRDLPGSSAQELRKTAHDLRHPEEWRAAVRAQNALSEGRLQALALASSCWSDDPDQVRLGRIEEVLPQLNRLADQAVADGRLEDQAAIGEDIAGLWRLREALQQGR